jgi:hypothetical protein
MAKKKKLPTWATTVTPFSKFLALSMLVIFPIVGFYLGRYYERTLPQHQQKHKQSSDCVTFCSPKPTQLVVNRKEDGFTKTITDTKVVQKLYKELEAFKVFPPGTAMGCPMMPVGYKQTNYDLTFYKNTQVLRHVLFSPSACRVSITLDDNTVEMGLTVESLDFTRTLQQSLNLSTTDFRGY